MRERIISTPGSSISGVHTYVSPWRKWALLAFVSTALVSVIFSCLAIATYTAFNNLVSDIGALPDAGDPMDVPAEVWTALFGGAAASSAFAVILTVVNITLSTLLLCCSRQSVANPQRTLSKSFLVASCWYAMLHVANITSQFYSFRPLMHEMVSSNLGVSFNTQLLTATVAFGVFDTLLYLAFGACLVPWVERPDLLQVEIASPSARV